MSNLRELTRVSRWNLSGSGRHIGSSFSFDDPGALSRRFYAGRPEQSKESRSTTVIKLLSAAPTSCLYHTRNYVRAVNPHGSSWICNSIPLITAVTARPALNREVAPELRLAIW